VPFLRAVAQCWGEYKQQQKSSRDIIGEIQTLFNILMNINNFTINDMIYNINELIRNQSTINDKVNFRGKEDLFFLLCAL
jgi:hypothetical protein